MIVKLTKDESGKVTGYSIELSDNTPEELAVLEQIRDMHFWGSVEYDGRTSRGNTYPMTQPSDDDTILIKFKAL